jgi:hypothetical protein
MSGRGAGAAAEDTLNRTIRIQSDSNAHDRPWRVALERGFFAAEGLATTARTLPADRTRRSGGDCGRWPAAIRA